MTPLVYYSQNREDLILAAFLSDIEKGFYVDVGAYHPVDDSVTKYFYDRGWSGINIEPQKSQYAEFKKNRKRDVNLNIGVSDTKGELKLREYENGGLSTFSTKIKKEYEVAGSGPRIKTESTVSTDTMENILEEHKVERIHFLKIDVEGYEYEVLKGINWGKINPEVICIEADHIGKDWHHILDEANYNMVFFDGLNEYFLPANSEARLKQFKEEFPKMIASGTIPYYWQHRIDEIEQQLEKVQASLNQHKQLVDGLKQENESLTLKLREFESIRGLLKELLSKVMIELKNLIFR